jgi:hypothetical protein
METIEQCQCNYCPPDKKYINCESFGNLDGMDGSCHWCKEMMPYLWHMCEDESWKKSLMKQPPHGKGFTEQEAIDFINTYKKRTHQRK